MLVSVALFAVLKGETRSRTTILSDSLKNDTPKWLWVKTNGTSLGVGELTTHFRTYFSGDWDVHLGYGILTHGQMP